MAEASSSWKDISRFHELVVEHSLQKYKGLPQKGKPQTDEWTPLAAVLCCRGSELEVVALGTGSKCIGKNKMNKEGWIVNDSHAEIVAGRAFQRYLLKQLQFAAEKKCSVFEGSDLYSLDNLFTLKADVTFHFFASQIPCGDASIFPQVGAENTLEEISSRKRILAGDHTTLLIQPAKKQRLSTSIETISTELLQDSFVERGDSSPQAMDIHRTGAKCVKGGEQDLKTPGTSYHILGALRTKPGRGDPTVSMSCSDKLMRWNFLGCQGALLAHFIAYPIYFETFTFAGHTFNADATERALFERLAPLKLQCSEELLRRHYCVHHPEIVHVGVSSISHEFRQCFSEVTSRSDDDKRMASTAICWCAEPLTHEVVVQGAKQGVNVKQELCRKSSVSICKRRLFEDFTEFMKSLPSNKRPPSLRNECLKSYHSYKQHASLYHCARRRFLEAFPTWITNDEEYESFGYMGTRCVL